jgi:hypothetical protein
MLLVADQDAQLPWELVSDGKYLLAESFIMGRWRYENADYCPTEFPVGVIDIAHYSQVAHPEAWVTLLHPPGAPSPRLLPGGLLSDELNSGEGLQALHLIRASQVHLGNAHSDAPASLATTNQEDKLDHEMRPSKLNLHRNRPLITLSYVSAGLTELATPELTQVEQIWAPAFIDSGCSGFVGPLWAVHPAVDAAFTGAFYHRLWTGSSLGEAFWIGKQSAQLTVPDSLDWLAYVLFGDPMARPYRRVTGQGYAVVEPLEQAIDAPLPPGREVVFRVTLQRKPPVWHDERVIEVPEEFRFERLQARVLVYGLTVAPGTVIEMRRTVAGDYQGWFSLLAPAELTGELMPVHIYLLDGPRHVHDLRFPLKVGTGASTLLPGYSSPTRSSVASRPVFIDIALKEPTYRVDYMSYKLTTTEEELGKWTTKVLECFERLEMKVRTSHTIDLDSAYSQQELSELARFGRRAFQCFFEDRVAKSQVRDRKDGTVFTFISDEFLFPWEVLYQGEDFEEADPYQFWGFRYIPARQLRREKYYSIKSLELPSDMLLCLHHQLRHAHEQERPALESIVNSTAGGRLRVLGPVSGLTEINSGPSLLKYLYKARHNMLHFACHCAQTKDETDELVMSLIDDSVQEKEIKVIKLAPETFLDTPGKFERPPMVFINACQSGGGPGDLRKTFNLPRELDAQEAPAIIATACSVPDIFAAAFARVFYKNFLRSRMPIGEALYATRWHFLLEHNNPLGLAYGLYTPADYQLASPPSLERATQ